MCAQYPSFVYLLLPLYVKKLNKWVIIFHHDFTLNLSIITNAQIKKTVTTPATNMPLLNKEIIDLISTFDLVMLVIVVVVCVNFVDAVA